MAKVITTVLKFPDDQTQKILEREDARLMVSFKSPLREGQSYLIAIGGFIAIKYSIWNF